MNLNDNQRDLLNKLKTNSGFQSTSDVLDADAKAIRMFLEMGNSIKEAQEVFMCVFKDKKRFERVSEIIKDKK